MRDRYNRHFCGGSLIRPDVVLTAAHCLDGDSPIQIYGGGIEGSGQSRDLIKLPGVKKIILHSKFHDDFLGNDLAVIVLSNSVDFNVNKRIKMIKLHSGLNLIDDLEQSTDGSLTATGWGTTDYTESPGQLQMVHLNYAEINDIEAAFDEIGDEDEEELDEAEQAANEKEALRFEEAVETGALIGLVDGDERWNSNVCFGDSGGPLTYENQEGEVELIGVASFIFGNCGIISFYNGLAHQMYWKESSIKEGREHNEEPRIREASHI